MGTTMVEKQPSSFPEVPAQQSIMRKKGSFGSPVLLPAVAWQLCGTDVARGKKWWRCWEEQPKCNSWHCLLCWTRASFNQSKILLMGSGKITFLMALSGSPKWHVSVLTQGLWCWGHIFWAAMLEDGAFTFLFGGLLLFRTIIDREALILPLTYPNWKPSSCHQEVRLSCWIWGMHSHTIAGADLQKGWDWEAAGRERRKVGLVISMAT